MTLPRTFPLMRRALGSHHQLRKLNQRVDLMHNATRKNGGLYLYANQQVCIAKAHAFMLGLWLTVGVHAGLRWRSDVL